MTNSYRLIPNMNILLEEFKDYPPHIVKEVSNQILDLYRNKIKENKVDFETKDILDDISNALKNYNEFSLKSTINASGVILHTNLGRAILSEKSIERINEIARGYSNLEYNLEEGKRGSRYTHLVETVKKVTGCEDAIIVNNNAAAVFLMLNTFCKAKDVVISRGELVEIGDSFRISEIMKQSGANLIEVGATNRTHLFDYEDNITENTNALMKVHTSNYKVIGFSESVGADKLKDLAKENGLYVFEDLGSGSLVDFSEYGLSYERTVQDSIKDGVDLVSFSCDKMIGSAQGGIICGKSKLIKKIKKNQLLRAFRVGKLTLAAVEATLNSYLDLDKAKKDVPTVNMITMSLVEIEQKAQKLYELLSKIKGIKLSIEKSYSKVGGGAYPEDVLESRAICIDNVNINKLEEHLRLSKYHIISTVHDDKLFLDLRCIFNDQFEMIKEVLKSYYE
ncbi:MAG: L-seryl-tRNA(Sec) selenium transferase [Tissierellia bacterium]|nr:L-seryl-tRNA(Sec) selenium transferase [Tissierellia bacterium]